MIFKRARVVAVGDIPAEVDPRTSPPLPSAYGTVDLPVISDSGPRGHSVCLRFLDGADEVITMTCGFRTWVWDEGAQRWCSLATAIAAESSQTYESSVTGRFWVQLLTPANIGVAKTVEIWIAARTFV